MSWLEQLLPSALVRALGWTLVHSLWQGAVVALALAGLLLLLRQHSAEVRYRTAALGLVMLLLLSGITFVRYFTATQPASSAQAVSGFRVGDMAALKTDGIVPATGPVTSAAEAAATLASTSGVPTPTVTGLQAWLVYFDQNIPVLVALWLLGLLAMTLRLLGGLAYVQRLRRYRVQPLAMEWQERLASLATRAGLTQPVELLESALVRVPVVVGHLRPVILLPLGTVTGLSTAYLEAILAHELAHVQRRDYLMNLLQSVAETIMFYHPAVWFITACLRTERENCCDDVATSLVGGNPLTVARALAALAELSAAPEPANQFAMSALGPDGSVLGRIRRLVQGRTAPTFSEGFMAACVVLGGLVLLTSAVAMADPRPTAQSAAGDGALSRLPFLDAQEDSTRKKLEVAAEFAVPEAELLKPVSPEPSPGPLVSELGVEEFEQLEDAENTLSIDAAAADEDDKDKKRRKRAKQVVVVQEPRRGRTGTVVFDQDKKGRITNLMVDGQPIDTGTNSKKKSKSTAQQVEVIQLPVGSRTMWSGISGAGFNGSDPRRFIFSAPHLNDADIIRIQRDNERALADASRELRATPSYELFRKSNGLTYMKVMPRLHALEGAERSLISSLRDANLNEEQRQHISRELAKVQRQKAEARSLGSNLRILELEQEGKAGGTTQEMEAAGRELEAEMRRHNAEMRRLEADMRRHTSDMRQHDAEMRRESSRQRGNDTEAAFRRELQKDGLIKDGDNFQLSLNATSLMVNGKKQSAAMRDKYLRLAEAQTGRKLGPKSTFAINRQTNTSTHTTSDTTVPQPPRPPRPPRAPQAPSAPGAPSAPDAPGVPDAPDAPDAPDVLLPPAPPKPPRIDSDKLRSELRKDGLLGTNERNFQFQLNEFGLTVNGKKQSKEVAEKYRKLLDAPTQSGGKTRSNLQISISE